MKFPLIILAIILIGGAAVLLTNNSADAPTKDSEVNVEVNDEQNESVENSSTETVVTENDPIVNTESEAAESDVSSDTDVEVGTEAETPASEPKVFTVSGTNFAFDVEEIKVSEGDTVTINFTSASGFHDWVVDEFDATTDQVRPGTPTSVTFVADKAGTYEYYCSVGSHRAQGMVGTLIVE